MAPSAAPILVVDDDPAIRRTVCEILDFEGYPFEQARNGVEALEIVEQSPPGLVLLDMRMPVMDGWRFAAEVQRRGLKVPILVMTAAQSARRWAEEIDAAGYVAKPFELDELLTQVERLWPRCDGAAASS